MPYLLPYVQQGLHGGGAVRPDAVLPTTEEPVPVADTETGMSIAPKAPLRHQAVYELPTVQQQTQSDREVIPAAPEWSGPPGQATSPEHQPFTPLAPVTRVDAPMHRPEIDAWVPYDRVVPMPGLDRARNPYHVPIPANIDELGPMTPGEELALDKPSFVRKHFFSMRDVEATTGQAWSTNRGGHTVIPRYIAALAAQQGMGVEAGSMSQTVLRAIPGPRQSVLAGDAGSGAFLDSEDF